MNRPIAKILCIALTALLIAFMGIVYLKEEKRQQEYESAHYEYEDKTSSLQAELRVLEKELAELEKDIVYCGENTNIMVGFEVKSKSDLSFISKNADLYQFIPIIVIACSDEMPKITDIAEAVPGDWEIMLYVNYFSDSEINRLKTVKTQLKSRGKTVADVVFSRIKNISEKEADLLKNAGFKGYTVYHNTPISGQVKNGLVHFDFSRITSDNISVDDRLSYCYGNKASMLFVFDMESIQNGNLSNKKVLSIMDKLSAYAKEENCSFATSAETVTALSDINKTKNDIEAERLPRIEQITRRIAELEKLMKEIHEECFSSIP